MRWWRVVATRRRSSETIDYAAEVTVDVWARSREDAMRRVRPDFRNWHLAVGE